MKFGFYIVLFLSLTACNLDLPVEDKITGRDAIDNVFVANETLSGIYSTYPKNFVNFSVLADDFYPNRWVVNQKFTYDLYKWVAVRISVNNFWADYYRVVSRVNVLQESYPFVQTKDAKEKVLFSYIKAQALALKAFAYFDLVKMYAPAYLGTNKIALGIILKDKVQSQELPRSSLEKSYEEIEKILQRAIKMFPKNASKENFRLGKKATQALLARVYLHYQKYQKAIEIADEILNDVPTLSKSNYEKSWKTPRNNSEILLAFENLNGFNLSDIYDGVYQQYMFYVNKNIHYDAGDYRKNTTLISENYSHPKKGVVKENYLFKYRDASNKQKPKPVRMLTVAELYFIKAECLFKQGKTAEAKQTLNQILTFRNAKNYSGTITLENILLEKQKEFLGEGLRYFDLKRNQINLKRVSATSHTITKIIKPSEISWLFPIPRNEMKQNKNAKQNPGWRVYD